MGQRLKPTENSAYSPFAPNFGERIDAGQDNFVRSFEGDTAGSLVVKISQQKGNKMDDVERAKQSTLYKKKKYEILKLFLGDFIPDSFFVVGNKTDGVREPRRVAKSYTVQERVPNVKISELSPEQRQDERLQRQMYVLVRKLQNMYSILDRVHRITGHNSLDGKLDLGGISKYVRKRYDGTREDAVHVIEEFQTSPNLLVDPETMHLYCVDFDDGYWDEEKEAAKGIMTNMARTDELSRSIIELSPELPQHNV